MKKYKNIGVAGHIGVSTSLHLKTEEKLKQEDFSTEETKRSVFDQTPVFIVNANPSLYLDKMFFPNDRVGKGGRAQKRNQFKKRK